MIKLLSLFSGIGAFEKALDNIGIDYELVNYCEIDKYAATAYAAIHGEREYMNLGDITKVNPKTLPDFNLMTWGFPCQDISIAGNQKGIKKGTRSGLYHVGYEILRAKLPEYTIIENVKNLIGKKHREQFDMILSDLEALGYTNHWKVLNSKDFGIPQSRNRVFIVSILGDQEFRFPDGVELQSTLSDMLEPDVDNSYFLSEDKTRKLLEELNPSQFDSIDYKSQKHSKSESISHVLRGSTSGDKVGVTLPCLTPDRASKSQNGKRFRNPGEPMNTLTGQDVHGVLCVGRVEGIKGHDYLRRVYDSRGIAPTVATVAGGNQELKILDSLAIRRLTPLEYWRLMGFTDKDYEKVRKRLMRVYYNGNDRTRSQMYKMAGNSIVVQVLEHLFLELFVYPDNEFLR